MSIVIVSENLINMKFDGSLKCLYWPQYDDVIIYNKYANYFASNAYNSCGEKYISDETIRMFMLIGKIQNVLLQFYMYSQYFDLILLTSVCYRLSLHLLLISFFSQIKLYFQILYVFIIPKLPAEAFSMIKWFLYFPINRSIAAIVVVYLEKE